MRRRSGGGGGCYKKKKPIVVDDGRMRSGSRIDRRPFRETGTEGGVWVWWWWRAPPPTHYVLTR